MKCMQLVSLVDTVHRLIYWYEIPHKIYWFRMSKLNQIQNALKDLDGGKFQKLCDSYLQEKGYANLDPLGSVFGADKVRKGTPDSAVRNDSGKLTLVEYTTQQDNLPAKLSSDIDKCLDETKTGIRNSDIEEIILCHSGRLTLQEEQSLHQKTAEQGVTLKIYSIEGISFDLYRHFPGITKDFLGVSVDTGQILAPDDFVSSYGKSQYSTPLDTEFHFREKEIEQALSQLNTGRLLLISGSAGVGKSRLALEAIRQFKAANTDYELFCIRDRGQDLFEDLKVYFSRPGRFLLLVDDANRIGKFDYVTHLLQDCREDQEIKVVATVRDYAIDKVKNASSPLGHVAEISIPSFEKAQIRELIEKIYSITNNLWLDRICEIAAGNPRLAVMAAKIAIEEDGLNSIRDVSTLYDQYFCSIRDDLQALNDANVLKVAGIISLFRSVDKTNEQLMDMIRNAFGIDAATFWRSAQLLHAYELVDMYENEVVKIADQVLATYLFYLCVFKNGEISLKTILEQLFPSQINRIRDAIYPCLNSFDYEQLAQQIRPVITNQWATYRKDKQEGGLRLLIETFWFLLQTDTLSYVHERVQSMDAEAVDWEKINWEASNNLPDSDSLLPLLAHFSQAEGIEFKMALELMFQYAEKKSAAIPDVLRSLSERFGFNRYSHLQDYSRQHILIDLLIERTDGGDNLFTSRLFIAICKKFLHTQFDDTESHRRSITIHKFRLLATPALLGLRAKLWNHIFTLFNKVKLKPYVIKLLSSYSGSGYYVDVKEIAEHDCEQLVPFLTSALNPEFFQHCLIVKRYIQFAASRELNLNKEELSERFNSKAYQLYKILSLDYCDRKDDIDFSNFEKYKRTEIDKYTQQFSLQDYQNLLLVGQDIYNQVNSDHKQHQVASGLWQVFTTLADRDLDLYTAAIDFYLSIGEPFKFNRPILLIEKIIEKIGLADAKILIEKHEYPAKFHWVFAFYQALKTEQITLEHIGQLYTMYEKAELGELPYDFDYLLKFLNKDSQTVVKITRILVSKAAANQYFGRGFELLFNQHTEANKQISDLFKGNETILKQAYLAHERVDSHADYDGRTLNMIMNGDPDFLLECIDRVYSDHKYPSRHDGARDYSFIWTRDDAQIIMSAALRKILSYETARGFIRGSYLQRLFCVGENRSASDEAKERQDKFLKTVIESDAANTNMMSLVFGVIGHFEVERRVPFVAHFLAGNHNLEAFQALPLEPDTWGWSGSAVPMIAGRISYWESLLPFCNSIKMLQHRKYVEERVEGLQRYLEAEKKSDFINDE